MHVVWGALNRVYAQIDGSACVNAMRRFTSSLCASVCDTLSSYNLEVPQFGQRNLGALFGIEEASVKLLVVDGSQALLCVVCVSVVRRYLHLARMDFSVSTEVKNRRNNIRNSKLPVRQW